MDFIEKVEKLPENIKEYFISNEPRLALEKSCFAFRIPEESIKNISSPIGLIFVGDIKLENLPHIIWENLHLEKPQIYGLAYEINKRIFNRFPEYFKDSEALLQKWSQMKSAPVISEDEAWKKVLEIEPWILEEEKSSQNISLEKTQEHQTASEKLSLIDAMKKYPGLGEQTITSQQIRIKNFNDLIRPSIKNWLSDYTARLGYESHDSIERGNYLFQNENTRNLGYEDRQRLSQILKSFDEKTPLAVDLNTKQVVFSAYAPEKKQEAQAISDKFPIPNPQIGSGEIKGFPMENKPAYQPKTKEPGDDFEKVIGFGEKREEEAPPTFNAPRIVNLKEEKREKPAIAPSVPQPKNLLNIKELVEQSRKEREANNPASAPYDKPAMENRPSETKKSFQAFPFDSQKELAEKQQIKTDINSIRKEKLSLSPENNFIPHSYSQNIKGSNTGSFRESLDETEKKLFQTNNHLAQKKLAGGYYSPTEGASGSGMQFSSPHKLPFEQEKEKLEQKSIEPIQPEVPPKPKAQPYRIFPSTME
ncbi:MAG TPA: hypothetical protein P5262_00210 [Candidatus Moranbacteria bacterium]|nr:hypothetical protein [Candidatus Moranbacteria bacterium]